MTIPNFADKAAVSENGLYVSYAPMHPRVRRIASCSGAGTGTGGVGPWHRPGSLFR